ncbi:MULTISPECIES: hypothetical protein [Bizionia]|uniref:Uncharacterized protein n=1 Tax=Bizionia algoritergicola TaxID=291187 RepID=A0A5D0QMU4_9FLAO|nr:MULTISPECIES: hypothetical protein [Bizionia]OBX18201.1 hypothetical protein BAA08_15475 [Bizionia sp. APA-3]TYB70532.1 hypothetical protein ES675_15285 [Bizionia algoritergicola]
MNTSVLESKLKRHKISYSNDNGKIIIGKSKTDYGTLIGLVILPIIAALGISIFMLVNNAEYRGKIIAAIIFLFGTGFYNYSRTRTKKQLNNNFILFDHKVIKVKNDFGEYIFDSKNILDFEYTAEQIDEETYEGNLYLIDKKERKHQILGFDDENEKYVLNDLKWFSEYLINHVDLNNHANLKT